MTIIKKMSVKIFAETIGVHYKTVLRWINERTFFKDGEVIKTPGGYWILESVIDRLLETNVVKGFKKHES